MTAENRVMAVENRSPDATVENQVMTAENWVMIHDCRGVMPAEQTKIKSTDFEDAWRQNIDHLPPQKLFTFDKQFIFLGNELISLIICKKNNMGEGGKMKHVNLWLAKKLRIPRRLSWFITDKKEGT